MHKKLFGLLLSVLLSVLLWNMDCRASDIIHDVNGDGELIVVLDPGHGGENLGADYNGYIEKDMNMVVANAMYEELTKYEGITVYMTRWDDVEEDISLKNRAKYAQSVNADYLFCLHFNMSANNNFWGTEAWIQSTGQENRNGYGFATVQMETMADMGLYVRGIKTRLNDKGTDYYGILRHCKEFEITAILIEHCHVDIDKDAGFCDEAEELEAFGRADATSVAKYFGLSSSELGVDYSTYQIPVEIDGSAEYVKHDVTDPDVCELSLVQADYENYQVTVSFKAQDVDTPMQYYSYSVDGGETFSECFLWPDADMMAETSPESFTLTIDIEPGTTPAIVMKAYNKYDRQAVSNILSEFQVFPKPEVPEETVEVEPEETIVNSANELLPTESTESSTVLMGLWIALGVVLFLLVITFLSLIFTGKKSKTNKNRR